MNLNDKSQLVYWVIETMMIVPHYLMIFCYLIRGYRLYFVFNLGAEWEKEDSIYYKNRHRASQRWSLILLSKLIIPVILFCFIIFFMLCISDNSLKLYNQSPSGQRTEIHYMVSNFFQFFLELSLIFLLYFIRIVEDEYQMSKEIIGVTIILDTTPFLSLFVHENTMWLYSYLCINVSVMFITSVIPVILSYLQQSSFQLLSVELLSSLELILLQPLTLNTFEKFLIESNRCENFIYLDIFLLSECFRNSKSQEIFARIKLKYQSLKLYIQNFNIEKVNLDDENCLALLQSHCLTYLEGECFEEFCISPQFKWLKRVIQRQEIFNNRLAETSLFSSGNMEVMKASMVKLIQQYSE